MVDGAGPPSFFDTTAASRMQYAICVGKCPPHDPRTNMDNHELTVPICRLALYECEHLHRLEIVKSSYLVQA